MILIPLVLFVLLNSYMVAWTGLPFGKSFPLTLCASTLTVYLAGFLNHLSWGYYLLLAVAFSALFFLYRKKDDDAFQSRYYNSGMFFCIVLYILLAIFHCNRQFHYIDEFAHLGFMVKESWRLDTFYSVPASNMWYNKEYPPFFTLYEVLFCHMAQGFKEKYVYLALNFFELSLFLPIVEALDFKKKENIVHQLLLCIFFVFTGLTIGYTPGLVYNTFVYNSIYLDWPIAYLMAYIFYLIYTMDTAKLSDQLQLTLLLCALILTKQISLAFWLLFTVAMIAKALFSKKLHWSMLFPVILPYLAYQSWNLVVKMYDLVSKFSFDRYDFLVILKYFQNALPELETTIIRNYLEAFLHRGLLLQPISLSYLWASIIMTLIIALYGILHKEERKEALLSALFYFGGAMGYAYALLLSYTFDFGYLEGPSLTMYDRYALMYLLFGIAFIAMIYAKSMKLSWKKELIGITLLVLFIRPGTLRQSIPHWHYENAYDEAIENYVKQAGKLGEEDRLVVISQNNNLKKCALRYYLDSAKDIYYLDISYPLDEGGYDIGVPHWENDFWQLMYDYNYIYICDVDSTFDRFWEMVTDEELKQDQMYRIEVIYEYYVKLYPVD